MREVPFTTIVTPAASRDLVSLADLKIDLGISTDADDAYLQRAISRASEAIELYCGRIFAVETLKEEYAYGYGRSGLRTSRFPVISVTSIEAGGRTLMDGEDYRLDAVAGRIATMGGAWFGGPLVIEYTAGFNPIPLPIQAAVTEMVKALQFNRTRDPLLRSENILSGLYAYTLFDPGTVAAGTPQQVMAILDSYRVMAL
jgi:hypothetical protein